MQTRAVIRGEGAINLRAVWLLARYVSPGVGRQAAAFHWTRGISPGEPTCAIPGSALRMPEVSALCSVPEQTTALPLLSAGRCCTGQRPNRLSDLGLRQTAALESITESSIETVVRGRARENRD